MVDKTIKRVAKQVTAKAAKHDNRIALENIEGQTGKLIATDSEYDGEGISFRSGDILYGKLRPYLAKVYLASQEGEAVGDFYVIRPQNVDGRYLAYLLLSPDVTEAARNAGYGAKMPRVSWEFVSSIAIPISDRDEQIAIAAFLDHEAGKIDDLIAEQERLIAVLDEKRQAVISHAVTKGLEPNVEMKNSAIAWLGEVPAHWAIKKTGWQLAIKPRYGVLVPDHDPDGVPMLRIKDMTAEVTGTENLSKISQSISNQFPSTILEVGDLIVSVVGTIGTTRIVDASLAGANLSRAIARLVVADGVSTPFLQWVLRSQPFQQYVDLTCVGTAQRVLNMDDLSALRFTCPPLEEQEAIATALENRIGEIDEIADNMRNAINLLKERRCALISAAVTGKIDVRNQPAAVAALNENKD